MGLPSGKEVVHQRALALHLREQGLQVRAEAMFDVSAYSASSDPEPGSSVSSAPPPTKPTRDRSESFSVHSV